MTGAPLTRHAYRLGLSVAVVSVVLAVVLLPLALGSLMAALRHPVGSHAVELNKPDNLRGEWTELNVAAVSINEGAQTVTLRVTGFHNCPAGCDHVEQVRLFSVHANPTGALGPPPSATIALPAGSSEMDTQVTLPIDGDLIDYPFDHYRLVLGAQIWRQASPGSDVPLDAAAARSTLAYSVSDDIARISMSVAMVRPTGYNARGTPYDTVTNLVLYRPVYLRVLAVLLTLLVVLAGAYGVLMRPFNQIIPTVGGLVLGIWGVRSLLVGSYPPDSTGVDLVLETAILLLLVVIAVRAVQYMWPRASLWPSKRGQGGAGLPGPDD